MGRGTTKTDMQNLLTTDSRSYLKSPIKQFGLAATLICVSVYQVFTNPNPYAYSIYVTLLIVFAAVAAAVRAPRWMVYTLLLIALIVRLYVFVHIIANGEQDKDSTRDAAVEVTAQALLHGENAWNANPGVGVTTGPTSILLALPFVFLFGEINWLSFWFWLLFFLVLLWCDVRYRNRTWPMLAMIFVLGLFEFEYTLYWSLEELYYPILYFALAYLCAVRGQWYVVGALLTASILSRPSYIFMVMGFAFWYLFYFQLDQRHLLKMGAGFSIGSAVILLPFLIVGGRDLWVNNPWRFAVDFSGTAWPGTNFLFRALNYLNAYLGPGAMRGVKLIVTLLVTYGMAWSVRRAVAHPFWHIALGAFLAHTLIWLPPLWPRDYALIFVLPALLAIALTPPTNLIEKNT